MAQGGDVRTEEQTDKRKISPFYRTSSTIGAAAQKGINHDDVNDEVNDSNGDVDDGWNKIAVLALNFLKLLAESDGEGLTSEV